MNYDPSTRPKKMPTHINCFKIRESFRIQSASREGCMLRTWSLHYFIHGLWTRRWNFLRSIRRPQCKWTDLDSFSQKMGALTLLRFKNWSRRSIWSYRLSACAVTILNRNSKWHCDTNIVTLTNLGLLRTSRNRANQSTIMFMLSTPPRNKLHKWKQKWGFKTVTKWTDVEGFSYPSPW
jgi:hypothetical protein